jgi:cell wall-associated NlpC family hydrolase
MPLTDKQRAEIVKEAWSWVEAQTPYVGWSCVKGAGTDCGQLLFGIYQECGYVSKDTELPKDYSLQVAQHTNSTAYVDFIRTYMSEITPDELKIGDVIAFQIGLGFAHGAILVEEPYTVIHALAGSGVRAADALKHPSLYKAQRRYFTLKDAYCKRAQDIAPAVEAKKIKKKGKDK